MLIELNSKLCLFDVRRPCDGGTERMPGPEDTLFLGAASRLCFLMGLNTSKSTPSSCWLSLSNCSSMSPMKKEEYFWLQFEF